MLGLHNSLPVQLCGDVDDIVGGGVQAIKPGAVFLNRVREGTRAKKEQYS